MPAIGTPPPNQPPPTPPPPPGPRPDVHPQTPRRGTDGFAIASLVFGLIGGILLGLIFGVVALRRIRRRGGDGRGLAIAGIVLSCVWTVLIGVGAILVAMESADRSAAGAVTAPGDVSVLDLRVGDCVTSLPRGEVFTVGVTPCSNPHVGEVYEVASLPPGPWPGADEVDRLTKGCVSKRWIRMCLRSQVHLATRSVSSSRWSPLGPRTGVWSASHTIRPKSHWWDQYGDADRSLPSGT